MESTSSSFKFKALMIELIHGYLTFLETILDRDILTSEVAFFHPAENLKEGFDPAKL